MIEGKEVLRHHLEKRYHGPKAGCAVGTKQSKTESKSCLLCTELAVRSSSLNERSVHSSKEALFRNVGALTLPHLAWRAHIGESVGDRTRVSPSPGRELQQSPILATQLVLTGCVQLRLMGTATSPSPCLFDFVRNPGGINSASICFRPSCACPSHQRSQVQTPVSEKDLAAVHDQI
jgi:hypothetical protein